MLLELDVQCHIDRFASLISTADSFTMTITVVAASSRDHFVVQPQTT